jgi:L-seryl-tRNA(Ser) seleniumtransferase
MRAFRLDKMTLAALEATLRIYLNRDVALAKIPALHMLGAPLSELQERAETLARNLSLVPGVFSAQPRQDVAFVGGGSLPDQKLPTWVVEVQAATVPDEAFAHKLRTGDPAVLGRLREGKLVLDVRTIFPEQARTLVEAIQRAVGE